jgi:hypothetical protein
MVTPMAVARARPHRDRSRRALVGRVPRCCRCNRLDQREPPARRREHLRGRGVASSLSGSPSTAGLTPSVIERTSSECAGAQPASLCSAMPTFKRSMAVSSG